MPSEQDRQVADFPPRVWAYIDTSGDEYFSSLRLPIRDETEYLSFSEHLSTLAEVRRGFLHDQLLLRADMEELLQSLDKMIPNSRTGEAIESCRNTLKFIREKEARNAK